MRPALQKELGMSVWEAVIRAIVVGLAVDALKWAANRLSERLKSMMVHKERRRELPASKKD
jgi:hypothetical protein